MIPQGHPYHFLSELLGQSDAVVFLSKYIYTPDTLFDERDYLSIGGPDFSEIRIAQELSTLRSDQELALHSKLQIKNRNWHIPMIDFSISDSASNIIFDRLSRFLPKQIMLNMALYASGRSVHAYSMTLLSQKEWFQFMGRLLLVNPRDQIAIVDARWIGHRIIGGFASLRWSNNSGKYLGLPSRVPFPPAK